MKTNEIENASTTTHEIETDPPASLPELLADIAAAKSEPAPQRMALSSGRVVEADVESQGRDRLTIRSATGEVELQICMTEKGPLLRFRAADVELEATRDVKVHCEEFHVKAEKNIVQESGGDLRQRIGGQADVKVRGRMTLAARETRVQAKRGNVQIEANDDVEVLGERIKLNC
jgi:hypothetical protein